MPVTLKQYYENNNWNRPVQVVSILATTIGSFWFPSPDAVNLSRQSTWMMFGRVFLVVIIWILMNAFAHEKDTKWWQKVCITCTLGAIIAFLGYNALINDWVFRSSTYGDVLIGRGYTETIIENAISNAKLLKNGVTNRNEAIQWLNSQGNENLLRSVLGNSDAIWVWWSLFLRKLILAFIYLVGLPLLSIALISAIQTASRMESQAKPNDDHINVSPGDLVNNIKRFTESKNSINEPNHIINSQNVTIIYEQNGSKTVNNNNQNLNVSGSTVGNINQVAADIIKDSFNNIEKSDSPDDLKIKLKEMGDAVTEMCKHLPETTQQEVAKDVKTLTDEALSKSPRKKWYELSAEGLLDAAKTVGELASPVVEAVKTVLSLISPSST